MTYSLPPLKPVSHRISLQSGVPWLVIGLFGTVILLELVTLADYVFSYLYIGPILLANLRLSRRIAVYLTVLACILIIFNLWIPGSHIITPSTVGNRLIAVFALVVTETLSSRNRYYEEALAQQKAKLQFQEKLANLREDFVSTLTHDLKTPLLGAIETLKALQSERLGPVTVEQQKIFSMMARSHEASLQLVETVLDVYHNDAEGVRLQRSPVNVVELARQVIESLSNLASSYQVSIVLDEKSSQVQPLQALVDGFQVQRVLSNLLTNAIYHSPINGKVEVVVEAEIFDSLTTSTNTSSQLQIKVIDQGPGIRPEEASQLFDRFYQGYSDRQAKGVGLGLYLSRQIVEAHGGTIWAENRVPRGATFGFCLPAYFI